MNLYSFFDELTKLGSITDQEARNALNRVQQAEADRPSLGQVARYGALGAVSGPVISGVGNLIEHGRLQGSGPNLAKSLASAAAKGAIASGAVPLIRGQLDRHHNVGVLKKYLKENAPAAPVGAPNA